jgi:hypothetical protein
MEASPRQTAVDARRKIPPEALEVVVGRGQVEDTDALGVRSGQLLDLAGPWERGGGRRAGSGAGDSGTRWEGELGMGHLTGGVGGSIGSQGSERTAVVGRGGAQKWGRGFGSFRRLAFLLDDVGVLNKSHKVC